MFGAHIPELVILMVVALVVFGPKRLPEIGHALGKGIRDFKKGVSDLDEHTADHQVPDPDEWPQAVPVTQERRTG